MSYEYRLEAPDQLTDSQLKAVRQWLKKVRDAVVHTNDSETWHLFNDASERDRRLAQWRRDPSQNDYVTSCIVVRQDGATLSLVQDDADRIAVDFATWWLDMIGGRLLDSDTVIAPAELIEDW